MIGTQRGGDRRRQVIDYRNRQGGLLKKPFGDEKRSEGRNDPRITNL